MHELLLLSALAGSVVVLIVSPGPNFLVITQLSISQSRLQGICASIGVATGSVIWATLAAAGLGLTFQRVPYLQPALQGVGGLYIGYIGVSTVMRAGGIAKTRDIALLRIDSKAKAYRFGLLTNMTNPTAMAFYMSVFTALTAPALPIWVRFAGIGIVAALTTTWFVLLTTLFTVPSVQQRYRAAKFWVDLFTGGLMTLLGARLLMTLWPAHIG